ncbi:tetratricopeptide repeat protein [Candidatus Sumerlaeota bacterium]|nr:tetratricopeptide repeat protein [Candidatus Sumerlaeota bacterium]
MSRRPRKPPITPSAAAALAETNAAKAPPPRRPIHILIGVTLAVFIIFEISMIVVFHTDDEIKVQRELTDIDAIYRKGAYAQARDEMLRFGDRWPGAKPTRGWNEKVGLYSARADDWATAARHYTAAVEAAPTKPKLHALAGEALYKSGDKKSAVKMLDFELTNFDPGTGDLDRANFYLGAMQFETHNIINAFQHFQAIANRDEWNAQLKPFYNELQKTYLQPAQQQAKATS